MEGLASITPSESVELSASSPEFYSRFFFPRTVRQASPPFHKDVWETLETPNVTFVDLEMFRGSAKTTLLRLFTSKRIAFGISRTILFVSASEGHSIKSIKWLKKQVEYNTQWAQTFQLTKGATWTNEWIEIQHGIDEVPINVLALGITGQTRGINIEDYRPDLIIVDDPCTEENTATAEQREKIINLFFGALAKSLVPKSECPSALMALLQTPLNSADLISLCKKDPQFVSHTFGCFDERGESRWPERWSKETLLADKAAHIARNQLPLWMREMECTLIADELCSFRVEWLQFWTVLPEGMVTYLAIDPTPPAKDGDKGNITSKHDYCALVVVGYHMGKVYLCEYYQAKGLNPDEVGAEFFRLIHKWRPMQVGVESVNYQRTLAWFLRKEMAGRNHYVYVTEVNDKRGKNLRIRQSLTGRASNGMFFVNAEHADFIDQFARHPNITHDDLLDAVSLAICLINPALDGVTIEGDYDVLAAERDIPKLENWRACP